ncbi:MAG: hemolysin family protein [Acidobacteriia bacterium]|nr:hemolysin family protein [Terriglobia bacterium]
MTLLYVLLALGLVLLNAFFVATEFAIVKVRDTRIEERVASGLKRAAAVREVLRNLNAYLSACQLGITLASLGLGWVGEPAFGRLIEPLFPGGGPERSVAVHTASLTAAFLVITALHVVVGEQAPKILALERPEGIALLVSRPIRVFHAAFYPLIAALSGAAALTVRALGLAPAAAADAAHSGEELRMILAGSHAAGAISATHARLLENALDFADRTVRQVMVPRGDVAFLDVNRPYAANLAVARDGGHTRYPLCDGDLDHVIGVVNIKDLFLSPSGREEDADLKVVAREPLLLPESLRLERALAVFQKQHLHLAIVLDEYGGTSGMVTLEDVLEELTGEIQDEFDQEPPKVLDAGSGRFSVDATLPLDEIEEKLSIHEDVDEKVDTLGGLLLARLGRIAKVGDTVVLGGRRVEVTRVRGRRILRLLVHAREEVPKS